MEGAKETQNRSVDSYNKCSVSQWRKSNVYLRHLAVVLVSLVNVLSSKLLIIEPLLGTQSKLKQRNQRNRNQPITD